MHNIAVDCRFQTDGTVTIRRVEMDDHWLPVEQGRQWWDDEGRHVLVMLPNGPAQELLLRADTLTWELRSTGSRPDQAIV